MTSYHTKDDMDDTLAGATLYVTPELEDVTLSLIKVVLELTDPLRLLTDGGDELVS